MLNHRPAAQSLAATIRTLGDDQLTLATPCPAYRVGDLVDHIGGLALAFTSAARKVDLAGSAIPPLGNAANLEDGWRARIAHDLDELATAWQDPTAYVGHTRAGGVDLDGPTAGTVALSELVLHGWDLAQAIGHPYAVEADAVEACHGFFSMFSGPGTEELRGDAFGPVIAVDAQAPALDRLLGLSGRDPAWRSVQTV